MSMEAEKSAQEISHVQVMCDDMWALLMSTIRYSFGRKSYIVMECEDLLAKYGTYLTPYQRRQAADEIREALQQAHAADGVLGDYLNDTTWTRIVDRIEAGDFGECAPAGG